MPSFYAFLPNPDGSRPLGTDKQSLFSLKTNRGAFRRARKMLGVNARVFILKGDEAEKYDDSKWLELNQWNERVTSRSLAQST